LILQDYQGYSDPGLVFGGKVAILLYSMLRLSQKQIDHIAGLARIKLTRKEKEKFSRQLTEVLLYVQKLKELNTKNLEITSQVTGLENVYRKDRVLEITQPEKDKKKNRQTMLKNAPIQKNGYIKVKAMLDKDSL